MKKKNLHLKETSTYFCKQDSVKPISHKKSQRGKTNSQEKSFVNPNDEVEVETKLNKPQQENKRVVENTNSKLITNYRQKYTSRNENRTKLRKKSKINKKWPNFVLDKENYQQMSCNAGFKNMKKYSRNYNISGHSNVLNSPTKQFSLSVEGAKCLITRRSQTTENCGQSLNKERGNKMLSFQGKFRNSCTQTHYSLQTPPVVSAYFKDFNFVINSIRINKDSFGRESYYKNNREEKLNRMSFPNKIFEVQTPKFEKHQRIRPSTSQPTLRNKFFLTSK